MPDFSIDITPLVPAIVLCAGAFITLLVSLFDDRGSGTAAGWASVVTCVVGIVLLVVAWENGVTSYAGMVTSDGIGRFFCMVAMIVALVTSLTSLGVIGPWRSLHGEYYALVLLGAAGMSIMSVGEHLVVIFFGLETLSLALYALAGYRRDAAFGLEASLKYFLLGSVASALLLYGIALVYGATGSLSLRALALGSGAALSASPLILYAGVALLIAGFGFKIAAVPFHMWVPDVYQGSPTPIAGYMATGVKAAAFAVLLRLFPISFEGLAVTWMEIFSALAILTMVVGNLLALTQRDLKRLLAYSSVAHAGYLLVALVAAGGLGATDLGRGSILFYSAAYAITNLGAFAALCVLGPGREDHTSLNDFAGLAQRRPMAAAAMALFLFSLAGIPPTAGFAGKFYIFYAAVATGHITLAIVGVLTSLLSVYYYLRVVVVMYMHEPAPAGSRASLPIAVAAVLALCAAGVLGLGIWPGRWMEIARLSIGG